MVCVLPQFVMFSLYVSSDSLATLLGAVISIETWRYVQSPGWKRLLLLGFTLALGLLTKATFVAAIPVLLALVFWVPRARRPGWNGLLRADVFIVIALLLGGYKFADNLVRYHDPFYNPMNRQEDWHLDHMRSYRGFRSFADVNVGRLLISPIVSPVTDGSYPVLLYGTFWYQHIPESNFRGLIASPFRYLGSVIFALALIPTAAFFTGLGKLVRQFPAMLRRVDASQADADAEVQRRLAISALALILVSQVALLAATALRYHEWSIFQARFLFPWFFSGIAAFSEGFPPAASASARILAAAMATLTALFLLYLSSEIALLLWPAVQSAATPR
jgi:4-amino-4-deoxy-L-arabinose transferase-like glycosyltransferase